MKFTITLLALLGAVGGQVFADGGEELYDHSKDEYEFTNLPNKSAEFDTVKKELAKSFPKVNIHSAARAR